MSDRVGKFWQVRLWHPREGYYVALLLCIRVREKNGSRIFEMENQSTTVFEITEDQIIREFVPDKRPEHRVGEVVYADVSKRGFGPDVQVNCQITRVRQFGNDITYNLTIVDDPHKGGETSVFESQIIRLSADPQQPPSQQLADLDMHEAALLRELARLRAFRQTIFS